MYIYICVCCQCLETLTGRQMDMQLFIADGCKEALLEEKRRFCYLVDKHCMLTYQTASFHDKVRVFSLIKTAARKMYPKTHNASCYQGDENVCAISADYSCYLFISLLIFLPAGQARDMLAAKLSSWQDQCNDATDVPESVLTMIDGLRAPVSITPMPSPSPSHRSVV